MVKNVLKPIENTDKTYQDPKLKLNFLEEYNLNVTKTKIKYYQPVRSQVDSDGTLIWIKTGLRKYFSTYYPDLIFKTDKGYTLSFKEAWHKVDSPEPTETQASSTKAVSEHRHFHHQDPREAADSGGSQKEDDVIDVEVKHRFFLDSTSRSTRCYR